MTEELTQEELRLCRYISATPWLLSVLYDMNLLPEQLETGTRAWAQMLLIASAHEHGWINE